MTHRHLPSWVFFFVAVSFSQATVTTVDILDSSDGVLNIPPPNILCVDVLVDVSFGAWYAGGLRAVAQNGASLRYATDPGTGMPVLTNPGLGDRFVTFFSRPRPRDGDDRYTNGAAAAAGRFSPAGPDPTATLTEINLEYYATPPPTAGSPGVDGAVFRISSDLPAGHTSDEYSIVVRGLGQPFSVPPNAILYSVGDGLPGDFGTANVGWDTHHEDFRNWYVAPIPEPATLLLASAALFAWMRR